MSERHACRLLGQWRGTQRYEPMHRLDEDELTQAIIALAANYGRYGYRRITALLRRAGWQVGKDRVQRIWRREGLKVPQKHRPRRRLWLNDGSCIRLRPERRNHVWSYDFVSARTHDGRTLRLLTLLDEYRRECLAIRVERRMGSLEVIETLSDVMLWRGIPEHIRSDNGPEFVAQKLRQWLGNLGTGTLYIEPGSPWENGYCESFNRDNILDKTIRGCYPLFMVEASLFFSTSWERLETMASTSSMIRFPNILSMISLPGRSAMSFGNLRIFFGV